MSGKIKISSINTLQNIFDSFCRLKVLIIGDVMIDSYLWGKVERISPEAPVPVLQVQKRDKRLGGAANVALNIQSLGANPVLCSVIGNDAEAKTFLSLLNQAGLDNQAIIQSNNRTTTVKHRVMSGAHHILRIDEESDHMLNVDDSHLLLQNARRLIPACDVIIFEDYDKGVIHKSIIEDVIYYAASLGIPVVVDPKKRNFLFYKNATLFKPNKKELIEGLKLDSELKSLEEVENAIKALQNLICSEQVLITLSEKGVCLQNTKETLHVPAHIREISDVSGAGDTVISIAALCVALKLPPRITAELSNLGGGLVCEHVGVVPIVKKKLLEESLRLNISAFIAQE